MSWSTVLPKIQAYSTQYLTASYTGNFTISAWSQGSLSDITDALEILYNTSNAAQGILDAATASDIILIADATATNQIAFAQAGSDNLVAYDLAKINNLYYFNTHGELVPELPVLSIIHEIAHLTGLHDSTDSLDDPSPDPRGDVVNLVNQIAVDIGASDHQQATYQGFLSGVGVFPYLTVGYQYTGGNEIDIARVGTLSDDAIDHSAHTTDDLVLGVLGDDVIITGTGADYVYGGAGEDIIAGGAGADHLYGEADNDIISGGDGNDIIDGGDGVDLLDGNDGNDALFGGAGDDVLSSGDGNDFLDGGAHDVNGSDTLNGGDGLDVASLNGSTAAITLEFEEYAATHDDADVTTTSIEGFVLSNFDDVVEAKDMISVIALADGDDTVHLNAIDHEDQYSAIVLGLGDGADTVDYVDNYGGAVYIVDGDADDSIVCHGVNIASVVSRANDVVSDDFYKCWSVIDGNNNVTEQLIVASDPGLGGASQIEYSHFGSVDYYASIILGEFQSGDFGITTGFSYAGTDTRGSLEDIMAVFGAPSDLVNATVGSDAMWDYLSS